jgi:hypothetical protein
MTMNGRLALQYDYDAPSGALTVINGNQSGYAAARGSFWVDSETLDLLQIDIEAYAIPSKLEMRSISDDTMYWRVLLGTRVVLLAHNSEFRLTAADGTLKRNTSVFSNCREYTADSTLTFESSPTKQLPPPVKEPHVQPGLQLQLALDKTIDAAEAAVGDPIRAHVLQGRWRSSSGRSRLRPGEPYHKLQRSDSITQAGTPATNSQAGDMGAAFR